MDIGPSFSSKLCHQEGTSWPSIWENQKRNHHIAHNLKKRHIKKNFEKIYDCFLKGPAFRESQLDHVRTEEVCM